MNQSSTLSFTRPLHLIQQLKLWKALNFSSKFFICFKRLMHFLKPGLGISCKNHKHMFADTLLLSFLRMPWSSHSCYDHRYSYFTRNIRNRYADCFKTLFRTWSQAWFAIVMTSFRLEFLVGCTSFVILTESIGRFICHQDRNSFGLSLGCFICSVLLNQCNIST